MPETLDLRGLRCPLPVLRLEAKMRRMVPGEAVVLIVDDPIARIDIPHAAREAKFGCETVDIQDSEAFCFRVVAPAQGKDAAGGCAKG